MKQVSATNRYRFLIQCLLLFVNALCFTIICGAQKTSGNIYLFKKDGNPTSNLKEAAFLQHEFSLNDTTFVSRYYHFSGPMIRQECYKDSTYSVAHGRFCWYNNKGELDSTGTVNNGKKDGYWQYSVSPMQVLRVKYEAGKRIEEKTLLYDKKGKLINNDTADNKDTIKHKQVQAIFKTGTDDWVTYCQENLHTPERLQNALGAGTHVCKVSFLINKQGNTEDIFLYQSCEWSGDAEVMRLIADSPQWQPAIQNDKPVIFRQIQSLSYQVVVR